MIYTTFPGAKKRRMAFEQYHAINSEQVAERVSAAAVLSRPELRRLVAQMVD